MISEERIVKYYATFFHRATRWCKRVSSRFWWLKSLISRGEERRGAPERHTYPDREHLIMSRTRRRGYWPGSQLRQRGGWGVERRCRRRRQRRFERGGRGEEVATKFARCSLRRGRSITDLQYSRRLHGGSFAAVRCMCACARACLYVCVYVYLPPPWKEACRQRGMETFCCRGRTRGDGGQEGEAVARGCCRWSGRRVVRKTDPQVVLNPLPTSCTSHLSRENPLWGLRNSSQPFFATEFTFLYFIAPTVLGS